MTEKKVKGKKPLLSYLSLSAKLGFVLVLVFIVLALGFLALQKLMFAETLKETKLDYVSRTLEGQAQEISANISQVERDLRVLSNNEVLLSRLQAVDSINVSSVEQYMASIMDAHNIYDQVRLIDKGGQELIRVERVDGYVRVIDEAVLQNKADRYYIKEMRQYDFGELYVSNVDLNREGPKGAIEVPFHPVVRAGLTLFDELGRPQGYLIANLNFDELLAKVVPVLDNSKIQVLTEGGYYAIHPDKSMLWGGPDNLNTQENILKYESSLNVGNLFSGVPGNWYSSVNDSYSVYAKAPLTSKNDSKAVYIVQEVSGRLLTFESRELMQYTFLFLFLFFVVAVIIWVRASHLLLQPINTLLKGAKRFSEGDLDYDIPEIHDAEFMTLRAALMQLAKNISVTNRNLDNLVDARTNELKREQKLNKDQQVALANVLDDVREEKTEVMLERDRVRIILNEIADGVIVLRESGKVETMNIKAGSLLNTTRQDALNKRIDTLLGEGEGTGSFDIKKLGAIEKDFSGTFLFHHRSNSFRYAYTLTKLSAGDEGTQRGFIMVFRDVTKEYEIDKAKTEFVSLASHQLRTPLSSISWYAEMLLSGDAGKLSGDQTMYLNEISIGSRRMTKLVNALLNVSRLELGTFMVVPKLHDISKLVKNVVSDIEPLVKEKRLGFTNNIPEGFELMVDEGLFDILVQNLLSNSMKYTPEGGKFSITIEEIHDGDMIAGKAVSHDGYVLCVADNGYGIPEHQKDKIFEKLFRADNVRSTDTDGTGLGLYIIKSIMDVSRGEVRFESEEGVGTTFHLIFRKEGMIKRDGEKRLEGGAFNTLT